MDGDEGDDELVMAMPRRELYGVRGVHTDFDLAIIGCLADETWFGTPDAIHADVDTKEVRLGVLVRRVEQLLVDEDGTAVFVVPVPAAATRLGPGLKALKELARLAGESLLDAPCPRVTLRGYYNEDRDEELRLCVVLLYEVGCASDAAAPAAHSWVSVERIAEVPLEPLSGEAVHGLYG